jgi:hypothetical protein
MAAGFVAHATKPRGVVTPDTSDNDSTHHQHVQGARPVHALDSGELDVARG